ncbi:MAG: DUF2304 domain-containing protein [Alicyclobacillus sp.]|nr:DUF2304 domain-containing protein [Alicyclobacillus sp.]
MEPVLRLTIVIIGGLFILVTYSLLIRRKVTERMTLLWTLVALVTSVFALFPTVFNRLAARVGVNYPPALLFLVTILLLMILVMYQSTQISLLDQRLREVSRVMAILQHDVKRLKGQPKATTTQTAEEDITHHEP